MNVLRVGAAIAAASLAANVSPDKYKALAAAAAAAAVYWARIGATDGEPTWPWESGSGGKALPGEGSAEEAQPKPRPVIDVVYK